MKNLEIAMNARIYYNIKTRPKLSILINSIEKQADLSFALISRPFNCCLYFKINCLWDGSCRKLAYFQNGPFSFARAFVNNLQSE
jgi:hypothetical protein